jgi:hypothetical protein
MAVRMPLPASVSTIAEAYAVTARGFAALFGGAYVVLGLAGFIPALWERPGTGPALTVRVFHAAVLGVFVVNVVLSMAHLVIGLWGVMAANSRYSALVFARGAAAVFLILAIAGFIPVDTVRTAYGTAPLYGNNAWLHLATGAVALFFAFRPGYHLTQVGIREELNPHLPMK